MNKEIVILISIFAVMGIFIFAGMNTTTTQQNSTSETGWTFSNPPTREWVEPNLTAISAGYNSYMGRQMFNNLGLMMMNRNITELNGTIFGRCTLFDNNTRMVCVN